MPNWPPVINIIIALILVALNGFFVAAEFALVKVRLSRIAQLAQEGRPFAATGLWLAERLDRSLSACQLGITMASLALGWVGEPAFFGLLEPWLKWLGIESEDLIHALAFVIGFSLITALHLVIGEQAPKIFAIRRPESMTVWCAPLLKFFYVIFFPFLAVLNHVTSVLLRLLGVDGSEHEVPPTEEELRLMLHEAHLHGHLTRSEHRLIDAVFEFDDMICRRVMVPRSEVVFFDVAQSLSGCLDLAKQTRHTRYPLCDGSLDKLLGVIHMKDLIGLAPDSDFDLKTVMRPAHKVPENMPISRVLRHFQATHQLLAFVVDEYGTIIGIVMLENVLEKIVGPVDDEFDVEEPSIVRAGPGEFIVLGTTSVEEVERELQIEFADPDVDTVAGAWMSRSEKIPAVGDCVRFAAGQAEVLQVRDDRAVRIRFTLDETSGDSPAELGGDQRGSLQVPESDDELDESGREEQPPS